MVRVWMGDAWWVKGNQPLAKSKVSDGESSFTVKIFEFIHSLRIEESIVFVFKC